MSIMKRNRILAGLGLVVAFFVPAWWREIGAGFANAGRWLFDAYTVIYVEGEILISACFALAGFK
jgi:hypothetical protein